jgi:hypothetical protein
MENIVYVLINEAMPGYIKISMTDQSLEQRVRQLDTTGIPMPFEVFIAVSTTLPKDKVEAALHDAFRDVRVRSTREFFKLAPERTVKILRLLGTDVTPNKDFVESAEDQRVLEEARTRRPIFNFDMVGIPVGAVLTFDYDETIICTVADKRKVDFKGKVTSLNDASLQALEMKGYRWKAVQGPAVWLYEGETLLDRRTKLESAEQ